MSKKVSIVTKPKDTAAPPIVDAWAGNRDTSGEPGSKQGLTSDIPESLHRDYRGAMRHLRHEDGGRGAGTSSAEIRKSVNHLQGTGLSNTKCCRRSGVTRH